MNSRRRDRELERAQRLLRRVDLEEVLDALGVDVLHHVGSDAYSECPDPGHDDANPSFHVCVEDVVGRDGRDRLGAFNCWSHPGEGLSGANFLDLAARILRELWGEDFPRDDDRDAAATWIRRNFLSGDAVDLERLKARAVRVRRDLRERRELSFPPSRPIADADPRFRLYLERRGITPERAAELDVRAVPTTGRDLRSVLGDTVPAVLFPILREGEPVNWYARAISRFAPKSAKGRYAPVRLGRAGVVWSPDVRDPAAPLVLVEGIFDAERVRRVLLANPGLVAPASNVAAVLGGRVSPEQARTLRGHPVVIHLADGDAGGVTLSGSVEAQFRDHAVVRVRRLPDGTDPADAPEDAVLAALRPTPTAPRVGRRIRRTSR